MGPPRNPLFAVGLIAWMYYPHPQLPGPLAPRSAGQTAPATATTTAPALTTAKISWVDGALFVAEGGSGHTLTMDGAPDIGGQMLRGGMMYPMSS